MHFFSLSCPCLTYSLARGREGYAGRQQRVLRRQQGDAVTSSLLYFSSFPLFFIDVNFRVVVAEADLSVQRGDIDGALSVFKSIKADQP